MRPLLPLLLLALSACAPSVLPAFEQARDAALQDPGPAPEDWRPDAVVLLSDSVVDASLRELLASHAGVDEGITAGPFRAEPRLRVETVSLGPARCADCSRVQATLGGHVRVITPLAAIKAPVEVDLEFDAVFALHEVNGRRVLTLAPRKVRRLEVSVARTDLRSITDPLTEWISEALEGAEPVAIAEIGAGLPIRALRAVPLERHLRLELLTDTPDPVAVLDPDGLPTDGWRLDLSTDALLDLARIASFRAEPLPRDIVAEPTSLYLERDRFVLGLRLWRVKGRGWWRDYTVRGTLAVVDRDIALTPDIVEDNARSRGAAWANPLAALGQGVILKTLERALETSVPATHRDRGEALRVVVRIDEVQGRGAFVVAHGTLDLRATSAGVAPTR